MLLCKLVKCGRYLLKCGRFFLLKYGRYLLKWGRYLRKCGRYLRAHWISRHFDYDDLEGQQTQCPSRTEQAQVTPLGVRLTMIAYRSEKATPRHWLTVTYASSTTSRFARATWLADVPQPLQRYDMARSEYENFSLPICNGHAMVKNTEQCGLPPILNSIMQDL